MNHIGIMSEESKPNIFIYMLKEFCKENKGYLISLVILSILLGLIQTNGISKMTARVIDTLQRKETVQVWTTFYILCGFYVFYQLLYYVFCEVKTVLVNKMKPWARYKLLEMVMKVNNDVFSEINFTKLNSPIHRVADLIASIISDLLAFMLPNLLYVLVILVSVRIHQVPTISLILPSASAALKKLG